MVLVTGSVGVYPYKAKVRAEDRDSSMPIPGKGFKHRVPYQYANSAEYAILRRLI